MRMNRPLSVTCPVCEGERGKHVMKDRDLSPKVGPPKAVPVNEKIEKEWQPCKRCGGEGFVIVNGAF